MHIEASFAFDKAEYLRIVNVAGQAAQIHPLLSRSMMLLMFPLIIIGYACVTYLKEGFTWSGMVVAPALCVGVFAALLFYCFHYEPRSRYEKGLRNGESFSVHIAYTDEGIRIKTEGVEIAQPWKAYSRVWEYDDLIVFFTPGASSHAIALKRGFARNEDWAELLEWVKGLPNPPVYARK